MGAVVGVEGGQRERLFRAIATEIAAGLLDHQTILKNYKIDANEWSKITQNSSFQAMLTQAIVAWEGASNTEERVRLKAASMTEQYLPELWERLHDAGGLTTQKVEAFKQLSKIAGVDSRKSDGDGAAKVTIHIDMGADAQLTKQVDVSLPGQVIEHEDLGLVLGG